MPFSFLLDYRRTLISLVIALKQLRHFSKKLALEVQLLDAILKRVENDSFSVAVVGEFKRGKSTFINALLSQEILPSNILPLKAQAKDYVREDQVCLILKPLIERLLPLLENKRSIQNQLTQIVSTQRQQLLLEPGYTGGNALNLLCELKADLSNLDFSHLTIWQAHLQGVDLHQVNFSYCDLAKSVFTENMLKAPSF